MPDCDFSITRATRGPDRLDEAGGEGRHDRPWRLARGGGMIESEDRRETAERLGQRRPGAGAGEAMGEEPIGERGVAGNRRFAVHIRLLAG